MKNFVVCFVVQENAIETRSSLNWNTFGYKLVPVKVQTERKTPLGKRNFPENFPPLISYSFFTFSLTFHCIFYDCKWHYRHQINCDQIEWNRCLWIIYEATDVRGDTFHFPCLFTARPTKTTVYWSGFLNKDKEKPSTSRILCFDSIWSRCWFPCFL